MTNIVLKDIVGEDSSPVSIHLTNSCGKFTYMHLICQCIQFRSLECVSSLTIP